MEHWKTAQYIFEDGHIEIFENYMVSDFGRVKSINYKRSGHEKVLKQRERTGKSNTIFYQVSMYRDNKQYMLPVHRLILSSFRKTDYFLNAVVDHVKPRSSTSCINELNNLRWVTCQQNVSTNHCKALLSKTQKNHPNKSRKVKVTDLNTNETTIYPSAHEVERILNINSSISYYILRRNGFYKKRNLLFVYAD